MKKLTQLRIQKRIRGSNNSYRLILEPVYPSAAEFYKPNYLTFVFSENGQEIRSSFCIKNSERTNQTIEIEVANLANHIIPKFLTETAQVGSILVGIII